jgi:acyl dehydratase
MSYYFEDLQVGPVTELGSHRFTRDEIVDFASKFDPQLFHMSEEGAQGSLFGALCASGWHTSSVWLRLMVDHRMREGQLMEFRGERPANYGPSPGFEKIRWLKPVYVDDVIRFTTRVHEKRDVRSRPKVGLLLSLNEGHNQHGELAFSVISKMFVERRVPLTA